MASSLRRRRRRRRRPGFSTFLFVFLLPPRPFLAPLPSDLPPSALLPPILLLLHTFNCPSLLLLLTVAPLFHILVVVPGFLLLLAPIMKLPKFISSRKSRPSSAASSPISSPRLESPKTSSGHLKGWSERNKGVELSSPSPRSLSLSRRREFSSEITEASPTRKSGSPFRSIPHNLLRELRLVFAQFDANGDGKISAAELGAVLRSLGDNTTDEEAILMVKEVDADGDGFIDLQEFIDLNTKALDGTGEIASVDELTAAFHIFDLDRNGFITPDELHRVLINLGDKKCTVDDCSRMIRGVDRNGDGRVDFEEFKSMMTSA